ncbi:MAG: hypothetical protein VW268_15090 [Rhodospirillaceae bacterium]
MSDTSGKHGDKHWLVQPDTIRKLWIGGIALLIVVTLFDIWVHKHVHFGIEGSFGFYSWYGFATCAAMVAIAKGLGFILKREDTYYDDPD